MMKSFLRGAGLALATGLLATVAVAQDTVNVRLSFHQPSGSDAWQQVYVPYAARLEELGGGRIKVETYPDSVLHSIGDGFKALAGDITDVAPAFPIYMAKSFNLIHANELPRALPASDQAATRIVNEMYPDYYRKEYERLGVYLGFYVVTPGYDIITKVPVNKIEDLKGLKIRAAGGGITKMVESLGMTPVTMTIADAYTAFQQGILDGVILSTADMVTYRLHEIGKHNFRIGIARVAIPTAISPKMYDALPDDLKAAFDTAGQEAARAYPKMYTDLTNRALEEMKAAGVTIVDVSDEELKKVSDMLAPMYAEFLEKNKDMKDPTAQEVLDKLAELSAKYSAMTDEEIIAYDAANPIKGLRP